MTRALDQPTATRTDPLDLAAHAAGVFSPNGEDGILAALFDIIDPGAGRCLEVGPGNGLHGITTAWWGFHHWSGLLIEQDVIACVDLVSAAASGGHALEVTGDASVTVGRLDVHHADAVFVDLDGEEWDLAVLNPTGCIHLLPWLGPPLPRVLVVKYNPTIPWWVDLRGTTATGRLGASLGAFVNDLRPSHTLAATTEDRAIFVRNDQRAERRATTRVTPLDPAGLPAGPSTSNAPLVADLLPPVADLCDLPSFVVITDRDGRTALLGEPPFGINTGGDTVTEPTSLGPPLVIGEPFPTDPGVTP